MIIKCGRGLQNYHTTHSYKKYLPYYVSVCSFPRFCDVITHAILHNHWLCEPMQSNYPAMMAYPHPAYNRNNPKSRGFQETLTGVLYYLSWRLISLPHFCILMVWSCWPCWSIITSASSSTNITTLLGSTTWQYRACT